MSRVCPVTCGEMFGLGFVGQGRFVTVVLVKRSWSRCLVDVGRV